jgi:hypothetical protein
MHRLRLLAVAALALSLTGWARAAPCDLQAQGDAAALAVDPAALFEFGRCEALAGHHAAAVHAFESLLARSDSPRVRLELARSLAALGRRDEALAAYRAVQDARPPEPVAGWVASEMAALAPPVDAGLPASVGWTWHPRAGGGALSDSNVNAGPTDAAVQIFGLPFELSAASLAQHDVGAQAWLGLGATRPGEWGQWHADAQWSGTRYARHGAFSADTFSAQAGLARAGSGRTLDVTVALDSQSQRNGNGRDSVTLGAQGLRELAPVAALAWLGAAGRVHQRHVTGADGAFALGGASLNLRHALAAGEPSWWPASVEALLGVRVLREALRDADRSHTDVTPQLAFQASAGAVCDGCGLTLDLTRTLSRHDTVDPAFGLVRRDRLSAVSLTFARAAQASASTLEVATTWQCVIERSVNVSTLSAYTFDRTLLRCSREWLF